MNMKVEIKQTPVFMLKDGEHQQNPVLCNTFEMLRTLYAGIKAHGAKACVVVNELRPTLRWRIVTKREIRELAQDALEQQLISSEECLTLDFWFK